jgi:hypothetical protein
VDVRIPRFDYISTSNVLKICRAVIGKYWFETRCSDYILVESTQEWCDQILILSIRWASGVPRSLPCGVNWKDVVSSDVC